MKRKVLQERNLEKPDLSELKLFSQELIKIVKPKCLILLKGELGSGKTQFTRFFLEAMGNKEVMSPSFSLENLYEIKDLRIHHFDLYRLENDEEVESSGLWDSFLPEDVVIVEWAERIDFSDWPLDWEIIEMSFSGDHSLLMKHYAAAT